MRNESIRTVLVIAYIVVMSASLIMGLGIYRSITASNRQGKIYIEKLQDTKSFKYMFDLSTHKTIDNSKEIALNKRLNDILSNGFRLSDEEIGRFIDTWLINNTEVSSIHIISPRGEVLTKSRVSASGFDDKGFIEQFSEETFSTIDELSGDIYFGIADDLMDPERHKNLFVARRLNALSDMRRIGYIFIFFDKQSLLEPIQEFVKSKGFEIALADDEGNYINIYNGITLGEMNAAYIKGSIGERRRIEWTQDFHHVTLMDEMMGLHIIADMKYTTADDNITNIVIAILLIDLLFLFIGTMVIKRAVVQPLEKISSKAKRITEETDLSIRFDDVSGYAEAGVIAKVLNEMLDKINGLIKENREKEKQQRLLELSVVNHQVNPHFLFNTLNSVNVLIAMEDKKTALKLVASLARYYRACLSQEETINTVEQEIKVTKEYITIMQLKSPGLINADFHIDERLYSHKIPGMILQTLVENCLKYGIRTMEEPMQLDITIKKEIEKARMAIIVRDNGKGMEPEVCEKLLSEEKLKGKSGFGLRGTVKRIRLMYNIKAISDILKIDSKPNEYTEITIYIPIRVS